MPSPLNTSHVAAPGRGTPPDVAVIPDTTRSSEGTLLTDTVEVDGVLSLGAERHGARGGQDAAGHHPSHALLTATGLIVVLVGVLLPMVDFFIVNVALPTIDSDLHASAPMLELVVSAYATAYALLLVLGGRLGDTFGRKRLFLAGMAAFTLTSLACGLAPTAVFLVVARAAQGASAALMVPQVLATIQASLSGERRARALGRYGATGGIAAVLGQLLGG